MYKETFALIDFKSCLIIHILQTEKAINVILIDLQTNNYFHIIYFSDAICVWKSESLIQATMQNIHSARGHTEADG